VLVDDLSRLARDNYLMLSVVAELHFEGVRVVSVADGLDSEDEEATTPSSVEPVRAHRRPVRHWSRQDGQGGDCPRIRDVLA
jgi:hypothetical protein